MKVTVNDSEHIHPFKKLHLSPDQARSAVMVPRQDGPPTQGARGRTRVKGQKAWDRGADDSDAPEGGAGEERPQETAGRGLSCFWAFPHHVREKQCDPKVLS